MKKQLIRLFKQKILIIFIITYSSVAYAQEEDMELWTGIQIEENITKKLKTSFEQEFRFNENISNTKKIYSELGLSYKINKNIRIAASYRFEKNQKIEDYYVNRHCFYAGITLKNKIKRFALAFRTQYKTKYVSSYSEEYGSVPKNYLRNKLSLKYNIKKNPVTPFFYCESFYQLDNPEGNEFDKIRYALGVDYKINKKNNLNIFYMLQKQFNVNSPVQSYIIGIGYQYEL